MEKNQRLINTKWYTGEYGSGTLYATESFTYRYDDCIKIATDPGNDIYTYTYDFLGRKTQVSYPDSTTISYSYDDTNKKITFTNGSGYDRIYWYDWLNRLTKVEEEYETDLFANTTYQYDELSHLTSFTDAENHATTYEYTSIFGLTKIIYPDSEYEQYQYDNVGNLTIFTDCNDNQIVYSYDSLYRLIQKQYQDSSTVSFTYDLNSNKIRMDDNSPNTGDYVEYAYDNWNRLISEMRHISQDLYTTSCQYDTASRLTTLTYPDNMQILYTYDDLNRITQIKRYVEGTNDEILMNNVQYDTESLIKQFDYGNGLTASFSYDSRDRLLTIDIKDGETSFLGLEYTYDNNSNITQLVNGWRDTSSNWHSDTESYNYDGLDRLTSANCSSWSHTYTYDKLGNRNSKDGISYTINAVNEVTGLSDGTSFIYDDNGNRTQKTKGTDTWDYTYDYANRVIKVEKNSVILGEYTYDGDGKRIQATENSETTTYMYSGWNVLYEENSTGTACYIYGPKGKIAKRTAINGEFNTLYYHTDHLKSTRLVTDQSRNIVTAITYHPFGEVDTEEGSANETHLFTGKQKDETDLYYYGARYYDPELGRFISRDLYRGLRMCPQTLNRYTYCLNNPIKFIDPDGLKSRYYFGDNDNPVRVTPGTLIGGLLMALGGLIFILSLIFMLPVGLVVGGFLMGTIAGLLPLMPNSWQEDLDGDGKFETIIEERHPDGSRDRWVIEEDGTIYQTVYNPEGEITFKWKIIPPENEGEKGEIYVWDEESGEWLPDQDKNGIPDERESGNNPGEGSGNDGNEGGDGGNEGNNEGDGSEGTSSTPQARGNYYY